MITLKTGMKILFQGDSITDCGRARGAPDAPPLGVGYAFMIASRLEARHPGRGLVFSNRGTSGDRAKDLAARWEQDCLALAPDVVSILIGINDTWRRFDRGEATSAEAFGRSYRSILEATRDRLGARIVICEPFVLPVPPDRAAWREDLDAKIAVARALAREFGAVYVPFDGMFAAASTTVAPAYWAADGVHPTQIGYAILADEIILRINEATGSQIPQPNIAEAMFTPNVPTFSSAATTPSGFQEDGWMAMMPICPAIEGVQAPPRPVTATRVLSR